MNVFFHSCRIYHKHKLLTRTVLVQRPLAYATTLGPNLTDSTSTPFFTKKSAIECFMILHTYIFIHFAVFVEPKHVWQVPGTGATTMPMMALSLELQLL